MSTELTVAEQELYEQIARNGWHGLFVPYDTATESLAARLFSLGLLRIMNLLPRGIVYAVKGEGFAFHEGGAR